MMGSKHKLLAITLSMILSFNLFSTSFSQSMVLANVSVDNSINENMSAEDDSDLSIKDKDLSAEVPLESETLEVDNSSVLPEESEEQDSNSDLDPPISKSDNSPETAEEADKVDFKLIGTYKTIELANGVTYEGFVIENFEGKAPEVLDIPYELNGVYVIGIDSKAFINQTSIRELNVAESVEFINDQAFQGCNIEKVRGFEYLRFVGNQAFRDNKLRNLNAPELKYIGDSAFTNNHINDLNLPNIEKIGVKALALNNLSTVTLPASLVELAPNAFDYNSGIVAVNTEAELDSHYNDDTLGYVINPVILTVHYLDEFNKRIKADRQYGKNIQSTKEVVLLNNEFTIPDWQIEGYKLKNEQQLIVTPTQTKQEVTLIYKEIKSQYRWQEQKSKRIDEKITLTKDELLSFVSFVNADGDPVEDVIINVEPEILDIDHGGEYEVLYSAEFPEGHPEHGKPHKYLLKLWAGPDWSNFPLGNGYTIGDFVYYKNMVVGLNAQGLEKAKSAPDLILPHINPEDGTRIEIVTSNQDDFIPQEIKDQAGWPEQINSITDFDNNIRVIKGSQWEFELSDNHQTVDVMIETNPEYRMADNANARKPGVFQAKHLQSVSLAALEYVGAGAFGRNSTLTELNIPQVRFIGTAAFNACSGLTDQSLNFNRLTNVGFLAFMGCSLASFEAPNLYIIGNAALAENRLTSINYPELTYLGTSIFRGNSLTSISENQMPNIIWEKVGRNLFESNQITEVNFPNMTYMPTGFLLKNRNLNCDGHEFSKLKHLGDSALAYTACSELTLPELESIGYGAVAGCNGSPDYDNKVIFYTQKNLPSRENYIVNPHGVENPDTWLEDDFTWDSDDPSKVTGLSASGIEKLIIHNYNLELPSRARVIAREAFANQKLNSIVAKTVDVIEFAGLYNNQLKTVDFPQLREIGDKAFLSNATLKEINFPKVEVVGVEAFSRGGLKKVILPEVRKIGKRAFNKIWSLDEIEMPNVEEIDDEAFYYSSNNHRSRTLVAPKLRRVGARAFQKSDFFSSLIAANLVEIGDQAFASTPLGRLGGGFVNFPSLETLGTGAFQNSQITIFKALNLQSLGENALASHYMKEAYLPSQLSELPNSTFDNARNKEVVKVFLTNYENPNGLKDGFRDNTRIHVVNPTQVVIDYVDSDGNKLAATDREIILEKKIFKPRSIFNYQTQDEPQTVEDDRQIHQIQFVYHKLNWDEAQTAGVEIRQRNEQLSNGELQTKYKIGSVMTTYVYLDMTGYENEIENGAIDIYYDDSVMSFNPRLPRKPQTISTVKYHKGMMRLYFARPLSGGTRIEIPINWSFSRYKTPQNYQMSINARIVSGVTQDDPIANESGKQLSVAKPIYLEGTYTTPEMLVTSPQNLENAKTLNSSENGARDFGGLAAYQDPQGGLAYAVYKEKPVLFNFSISNLERDIDQVRIKVNLPKYLAIDSNLNEIEKTAEFDPAINPGWTITEDGYLVQEKKLDPTHTIATRTTPDLNSLYLSFPRLKSDYNVNLQAEITLRPDRQGDREPVLVVSDDISLYASRHNYLKGDGDPRFDKEDMGLPHGNRQEHVSYLYDYQQDREREVPYLVRVSSVASKTDLVNVRITDYDLDHRLQYVGLRVEKGSGVSVNVLAYAGKGEKLGMDPVIYQATMQTSPGEKLDFPAEIRSQISYLQIVFPANHKINTAEEFQVRTELRDKDSKLYDTTESKNPNHFLNHAVLSGDLYEKNTNRPSSEREQEIKDPNTGVIISKYDKRWDELPGNYFWHELAKVYIRDYQPSLGIGKYSSFTKNEYHSPGDRGTYSINFAPQITGNAYNSVPGNLDALKDVRIVDLLPPGLEVEQAQLAKQLTEAGATLRLEENYQNSGRNAIVVEVPELQLKDLHLLSLFTYLDVGVEEGTLTNQVYVTWSNQDEVTLGGIQKSPPGSEGEIWAYADNSIKVQKIKEISAQKSIRKQGALGWSYSGIETASLEAFEYRLTLANELDLDTEDVDIVDFLPYYNDRAIQELNIGSKIHPARGSKFSNKFDLARAVKVPDGYDVLYWNSNKDPVITGSADDYIDSLDWSTEPAENTKAIRIKAKPGIKLAANQRLDVIIPMLAVKNDLENKFVNSGMRAFNTFVHREKGTIRYLESNRVYNSVPENPTSISFTKFGQIGNNNQNIQPLAGAKFDLYRIIYADELAEAREYVRALGWPEPESLNPSMWRYKLSEAESDSNGLVKFENIDTKHDYDIVEVSAPEWYSLPETHSYYNKKLPGYTVNRYELLKSKQQVDGKYYYDFILSDEQSKQNLLNKKPLLGSLRLQKLNANHEPMSAVCFSLQGPMDYNNGLSKKFYTDKNGEISVENLPEGEYTLTEVYVPVGTVYRPIEPIKFVIDSEQTVEFVGEKAIINDQFEVKLHKLGLSRGTELPEKSLAEQTDFNLPHLAGYKFAIKGTDGSSMTATVGDNGIAQLSNLKSEVLYTITELEEFNNPQYAYNSHTYQFKIGKDGKLYDADNKPFRQPQLNFPNLEKPVRGKIRIEKTDVENAKPLVGVDFALYLDGNLIKEQKTVLTDDGKAAVEFDIEQPGVYELREVSPLMGYRPEPRSWIFVLPSTIASSKAESVVSEDEAKYGSISRIDKETEILLYMPLNIDNNPYNFNIRKATLIMASVTREEGEAYIKDHPNAFLKPLSDRRFELYEALAGASFKLYRTGEEDGEPLLTLKTDVTGKASINRPQFDLDQSYSLVEDKAPAGYKRLTQPLTFIPRHLLRQSENNSIDLLIDNIPQKGRVIVSKFDQLKKLALPGAEFAIFAQDDLKFEKPLYRVKTDIAGIALFDNLPFGDYALKEISAPAGFQLLNNVWNFTLNSEESRFSVRAENTKLLEIPVEKQFKGQVADKVTILLKANDKEVDRVVLNQANNWRHTFTELPTIDTDGRELNYTVEELEIPNYRATITGSMADGFLIVNEYLPPTTSPTTTTAVTTEPTTTVVTTVPTTTAVTTMPTTPPVITNSTTTVVTTAPTTATVSSTTSVTTSTTVPVITASETTIITTVPEVPVSSSHKPVPTTTLQTEVPRTGEVRSSWSYLLAIFALALFGVVLYRRRRGRETDM